MCFSSVIKTLNITKCHNTSEDVSQYLVHWAKNDNFLFIFLKMTSSKSVCYLLAAALPLCERRVHCMASRASASRAESCCLCPRSVATVGRQSEVPVGQPPPGVQGDGQLPGRHLHRLRHRGGESVSRSLSLLLSHSSLAFLPGCSKRGCGFKHKQQFESSLEL